MSEAERDMPVAMPDIAALVARLLMCELPFYQAYGLEPSAEEVEIDPAMETEIMQLGEQIVAIVPDEPVVPTDGWRSRLRGWLGLGGETQAGDNATGLRTRVEAAGRLLETLAGRLAQRREILERQARTAHERQARLRLLLAAGRQALPELEARAQRQVVTLDGRHGDDADFFARLLARRLDDLARLDVAAGQEQLMIRQFLDHTATLLDRLALMRTATLPLFARQAGLAMLEQSADGFRATDRASAGSLLGANAARLQAFMRKRQHPDRPAMARQASLAALRAELMALGETCGHLEKGQRDGVR